MAQLPPLHYLLILSSFAVAILTALIILFLRSRGKSVNSPLPPGPPKLPLIGNLHQLILTRKHPHHRLRDLARDHAPHVMHLQLGELPYVVVSSPESAKLVMKDHDLTFASRPGLLVSEAVFYGVQDIALVPYGPHWRQMRKICVLELLSSRRVMSFRPVREAGVSKLVDAVFSTGGGKVGKLVDMTSLLSSSACSLAYAMAFGMGKDVKEEDEFADLIARLGDAIGGFSVCDLFPSVRFLPWLTGFESRLKKLHLDADAMLEEIINEHKARRGDGCSSEGGAKDLVDVLLSLHDGAHDYQIPLTMESIKAVLLDLFLGGIETTSATVEWTMAELMRNPRVMNRAQEELRKAFQGKGNPVTEQSLHKLEYLEFVIQETLRLHPPLPLLLPREVRESVQINGYDIPSKTNVIVNVWAIARDPRYWKEPERYHPERFSEECTGDYKGTDFRYMPFGAGRRMCPGISFGLAVVRLMLANLLYHFDWKLPDNAEVDMTESFGASVRRKHKLRLIPVPYDSGADEASH